MNARRFALVLAATIAATTVSLDPRRRPWPRAVGLTSGRATVAAPGSSSSKPSTTTGASKSRQRSTRHQRSGLVRQAGRRRGDPRSSGRRTTVAPSGSFSVEKRIPNRSGVDRITGRATRGSVVCSTSVSLLISAVSRHRCHGRQDRVDGDLRVGTIHTCGSPATSVMVGARAFGHVSLGVWWDDTVRGADNGPAGRVSPPGAGGRRGVRAQRDRPLGLGDQPAGRSRRGLGRTTGARCPASKGLEVPVGASG